MFKPLYNWTLRLAAHKYAVFALCAISFSCSFIFPLPPDTLLVPMVLANRNKAFLYAGLCTVFSVIGGITAYMIGRFFYESIGENLLQIYGFTDKFEEFKVTYNEWGIWIVALGAVTPLPYKAITIFSGIVEMNLLAFALTSGLGRGFRFFLEATLLYFYGEPIKAWLENNLKWVATAGMVLLLSGFIIFKFMF